MRRLNANDEGLETAADLLRAGALVAFPTETVYGLGADAANPAAVRAIFAAKGRPADHPVIVHLPSADAIATWATEVPEVAHQLADAFWPGPLTLVLRKAEQVDPVITGGQETIGLRVPAHPAARALLKQFGGALAAPSANRFGHVSPTTADHVVSEFEDGVAAVVDGGSCDVGLESTIVDLTGEAPRLLRPGMIGVPALEAVLETALSVAGEAEGPRASGRLPSHYAPRSTVRLVSADALEETVAGAAVDGAVAVLARHAPRQSRKHVDWHTLPATPEAYARALYATLRAADESDPACILVERVPDEDDWRAIADRLDRAAA
jgi:L-threonylcarbamoyladenylate synthase